jgi:putative transposase
LIQIGDTNDDAWLWVVVVEPIHYRILGVHISKHRNMLVAESFLKSLVKIYGKHIVYSDDGGSMVSRSLQLTGTKTYTPYTIWKSIVERAIEYVKDRTEGFDD